MSLSGTHERHMATCDWEEIYGRWIRDKVKSNEPIRDGHVASEMTSHLTTIFSQPVWGEGKERETERERKEERF